jgi:expansin (peptidoglycan-binding protein)
LTYYGTGLGACGLTSQDSDSICAVSKIVFDAASTSTNPNLNPLCGRKIRIRRFDESVGANVSIDVTVVDRCVACQPDDLDLSPFAFSELANQTLGRVKGTWAWLSAE